MSGVAGAVIGLASGAQPLIAEAVALVQGTTTARGCTTNFIGFGLGSETTIQKVGIADFNATDDTVTLGTAIAVDYEPIYTGAVLTWEEPAP